MAFKLRENDRIAGPRQGDAGNGGAIARREARFGERLCRGVHHRREALLDPEADVRRASFAFAKDRAGKIAQPRAAPRAAAIYAQKKGLVFHLQAPVPKLI